MPISTAPRVAPAPALTSTRSTNRTSNRTPPQERRIRAASEEGAVPDRAVVILPGLGNNAADYSLLKGELQQQRLHVEIAPVARIDWARNAAGLLDGAYWQGTLKPRPTVDWYLERVAAAVEAARSSAPGAPVTLLAHSAGGWLGRLFMLDFGTSNLDIDRFVSLGSPHLAPPEGVVDQTRGILTWISENCPGAFHDDVTYATVAGKWLQGADLAGPGTWQRRVVGQGYKQVCGSAAVWGDGVVPVPAAHLEGAIQLTLDGVYHSPLGAEDGAPEEAAGGEVEAALAARSTLGVESTDGDTDEYEATPAEVEAAAAAAAEGRPGPRLWYGSAPVLDRWMGLIRNNDTLSTSD